MENKVLLKICCLIGVLVLASLIVFIYKNSLERLAAIDNKTTNILRVTLADSTFTATENQVSHLRLTVSQPSDASSSNTKISVALDGHALSFDVQPVIKNGRVMVQARAISEDLGAAIRYDDNPLTVTITKGSISISLQAGSPVADVNGKRIALDVLPEIIKGHIYVPIRLVAEAMGCQVDWALSSAGVDYAYNLDNGLGRWRAALADLQGGSSKLYNVCVLGDSIAEGREAGSGAMQNTTNVTGWMNDGFPGLIRAAFQARGYADGGIGFFPSQYPQSLATKIYTYAPRADWSQLSGYGVASTAMLSSQATDTVAFTFSGTGVGVIVEESPLSGPFSVTIDRGSVNNFNAYNTSTTAPLVVTVTGLTNSPHTCVVKGYILFLGSFPIVKSSGIRVNTCAYGGATIENLGGGFYKSGETSVPQVLAAEINVFTPVLTIIQAGFNDYAAQTPIATYTAAMQQVISDALQYGDVIILSPEPFVVSSTSIPLSAYVNADLQLAKINNCAFLDLYGRWGGDILLSYPQTLGFIPNENDAHPNDYGHKDIANFILSALFEGSSSGVLTSSQS